MLFDTDGSVEFTRNKALDAFFGGRGTMRRVTEIQKLETRSEFFIRWLMGPYANTGHPNDHSTGIHTLAKHIDVFGKDVAVADCRVYEVGGAMLWPTYELAVQYEIVCLNRMRENGIIFDHDTPQA